MNKNDFNSNSNLLNEDDYDKNKTNSTSYCPIYSEVQNDNKSTKRKRNENLNVIEKKPKCELKLNKTSNAEASKLTSGSDLNDEEFDDIVILNKNLENPKTDNFFLDNNFTLHVIGEFITNALKNEMKKVQILVHNAYCKINNGLVLFDNSDIPLDFILSELFNSVQLEIFEMSSLLNSIPAFSMLDKNDFSYIIKNKLYVYSIVKYHRLKINNESYSLFKNGMQCTRNILCKFDPVEMVDMIFEVSNMLNELNLNKKEFCALMVFIISYPKHMKLRELNKLIEFNNLVGRILAHELFTSKRNYKFVEQICKIIMIIERLQVISVQRQKNFILPFDE